MIHIRDAGKGDGELLLRFVRDLAAYEKLLDEVVATATDFESYLTAEQPKVFAIIAEQDGTPVGMALYFFNFSTFRGRHGLYIEDLYVTPQARSLGIGKLLLKALAVKAKENNCARMEWWVLDWNKPAIDFYERLGARKMDEWTVYRLDGDDLTALATP